MGILDDAIKEHLELKRQHGAATDELKQLEDEAFGAAERPGDEGSVEASSPDPAAEAPTEFMAQPDLEQSEETPVAAEAGGEEESSRPVPRAEIADLQEAPPLEADEPAEEESPAAEHEVVSGPTTEEREAIAEQPTEMYDVEQELSPEPEATEAESADEPEEEYEEDDDFWDEKRLSDELDQALEAPSEDEDEEYEEDAGHEDEPVVEDEPVAEERPPAASAPEEDVLEETPDFLEEAPEDDQLWFEQKPPKDFDFDD
jgi:hypothetical protein